MGKKSRKHFAIGSVVLLLVFCLLCIKLVLSVNRVVTDSTERPDPIFTPEVHAADGAMKSKATSSNAQPTSPTQSAASTLARTANTGSVPDMMNHLQQKEAELKRKEELLKQREEYLSKMKEEVEGKLKELIDLQKEIQAYRTEKKDSQNAQIRSLSKIYGSMKAKEAAKLLENLDDQLVVNIISTMNATDAANILANMDIKKAAKISESLSHQR